MVAWRREESRTRKPAKQKRRKRYNKPIKRRNGKHHRRHRKYRLGEGENGCRISGRARHGMSWRGGGWAGGDKPGNGAAAQTVYRRLWRITPRKTHRWRKANKRRRQLALKITRNNGENNWHHENASETRAGAIKRKAIAASCNKQTSFSAWQLWRHNISRIAKLYLETSSLSRQKQTTAGGISRRKTGGRQGV